MKTVEETRVHHDALFGVETLLGDVRALDEGYDGEVEMAGERVVAAVVSGHGHDGAGAVACEYVIRDIHGYLLLREGVDGVSSGEDASDAAVGNAVTLGARLHPLKILIHSGLLLGRNNLLHVVRLGCQHHERDAEDGVTAGGEDSELQVGIGNLELHLSALRTANPIALSLLDGVRPIYAVEPLQETLCIGAHAQTPLAHHALLHWITAAHGETLRNLVVGKHSS